MKRVLIFSLAYHPFIGGAEVAIKEITDRIDPKEYSFDMVTLRFDSRLPRVEKKGNVTIYRIGFSSPGAKVSDRAMPLSCKIAKILFPFTSFFKALSLNGRHRYDLVWAMMANQAGFGALFFKLTHPRTPYFLELQDGRAFDEMKTRQPVLRALWSLYRRIYLRADLIKTISNYIAKEVRGIGYTKKIEVIPNAVDVARFSAGTSYEKLLELQVKFGKGSGDVFLFTASRLVLSRGVEDVIQALQFLPENVKLLIAGEGEDRAKLEHLARGLDVQDRVIFAGYVDHKDLPAFLKISDIFVRPSLIEGLGNAFLEAMAAGIPIIGTSVGGIPDFLADGETGLFCEVQDPRSVAQAVERYLADPALVSRVVSNAKKLVAEKYDWNKIASDMKTRVFGPLTARG
ncbi:MAG TPA: glycosyltransferase family 4 protein [Candidatus Paceibacterota bacterium]|nr:glycosyltransferase family 4 protein [Candidatus Paceibacterota bacterium]